MKRYRPPWALGRLVGAVLILVLSWPSGLPWTAQAGEPIAVVTTLPVLKDLVQAVGRSHVRVTSLLSGLENEHSYSPKPSDLLAVRNARVLVRIGAGLEVWASGLLRSAGTRELVVLTASEGIELISSDPSSEPPSRTGRKARQANGNPHIWLDPDNVAAIIRRITETLSRLDSSHAGEFERNQAVYLRELDRTTMDLVQRLRPLSDRRIIVHHPAWPYFARRFDLQIVGEIQSQSGAEPSPRHLQALIAQIRRDHIKVIVSEPQLNQKLPRILAHESGARLVVLTPLPGGVPGTDTYLDMMRYNVLQLLHAFESA